MSLHCFSGEPEESLAKRHRSCIPFSPPSILLEGSASQQSQLGRGMQSLERTPGPPSAKPPHLKRCQNTGGVDTSNLFSIGFAGFNFAAPLSWNEKQKPPSCQVAEGSDKGLISNVGCDFFCLLSAVVFTCAILSP